MAAPAAVGRDDRRAAGVRPGRLDHPADRGRREARLVHERHDQPRPPPPAARPARPARRAATSPCPRPSPGCPRPGRRRTSSVGRALHDVRRVHAGRGQHPHGAVDQPLAVQLDQRLRPPEPPPGAGGEHQPGDAHPVTRHAGRQRPARCAQVAQRRPLRQLPRRGGSARRCAVSGAPLPPQRSATISAAIDTAVSSGVRAPMSSPIGERTPGQRLPRSRPPRAAGPAGRRGCAGCPSRRCRPRRSAARPPAAARRTSGRGSARRSRCGRRPAGVARYRCGHSTTTSSASGKRLRGGEHRAGVADGHPVAEELADPRDRGGEVDGAEDQHPRRRRERLHEDAELVLAALAVGADAQQPGGAVRRACPRTSSCRPPRPAAACPRRAGRPGPARPPGARRCRPARRPRSPPRPARALAPRRPRRGSSGKVAASTGSTKTSMMPPQVSPTANASSSLTPYAAAPARRWPAPPGPARRPRPRRSRRTRCRPPRRRRRPPSPRPAGAARCARCRPRWPARTRSPARRTSRSDLVEHVMHGAASPDGRDHGQPLQRGQDVPVDEVVDVRQRRRHPGGHRRVAGLPAVRVDPDHPVRQPVQPAPSGRRAGRRRRAPSRRRRPPRPRPGRRRAAPTGRGTPSAARRAGCRRSSRARPPATAAAPPYGSRSAHLAGDPGQPGADREDLGARVAAGRPRARTAGSGSA